MKWIVIFLSIIVVLGVNYSMLEKLTKGGNMSQIQTLLLINLISFCLFFYCKWLSARAAQIKGLNTPDFIRALDKAVTVNKLKKIAYYFILFYFGVMSIVTLNPELFK